MAKDLKCFDEEVKGRQYTTMPVGLRVVEIERVVGSVGKCRELDGEFRPRGRRGDRRERFRRARMDRAFDHFDDAASFPPIDVYLYRGEYYVVDGHRRLAAARSARREFMEAQVTEVVPLGDARAQKDAMSRRKFEQETGLTKVRLANEAGFPVLLGEIAAHPNGDSLEEKARLWYSTRFLPACRAIAQSGLHELFPGMREGDLFVMVARFHREFDSGFAGDRDFQGVLERFLAARKRLRWRLRGWPVFRRLRRLFRGDGR